MTKHYVMQQLTAIDSGSATDEQARILDEAKRQVGFIPNMYANMANVPAVLDSYLYGYVQFRKESGFSPPEQEVVFLAISKVNACSYCTAAHSMIADKKSGVPNPVLQAVRHGTAIPDAKLGALFEFAAEMVSTRGRPSQESTRRFLSYGYTESHILSIVLAISVKTLSNYSNHLFETSVDEAFSAYKLNTDEAPASRAPKHFKSAT
jgi:uncharacterized peroxidase-related enzyme